jgi:hypothetical protein
LSLSSEKLVSSLCFFNCNVCRYVEFVNVCTGAGVSQPTIEQTFRLGGGAVYKLSAVATHSA